MRRKVLSTDIFVDAEASKKMCDIMCPMPNSNCIKGFIQIINQNPFGFLCISDLQVWKFLFYIYLLREFKIKSK